ncbi:hypothetical protein Aph02nite_60930 [Actinoplanes philippinensis]|nr:hypothetical protein Aph02nite_60930 [Actinoplanes philippinensis]
MGGRGHPGGPVHLGARVLLTDRNGPAGVQAHPNPGHRVVPWPVVCGQSALRLDTRRDSRVGVRERYEKGVTLREKLDTPEVIEYSA